MGDGATPVLRLKVVSSGRNGTETWSLDLLLPFEGGRAVDLDDKGVVAS